MENECEIIKGMQRDLARKIEGQRLGCLNCWDFKNERESLGLEGCLE